MAKNNRRVRGNPFSNKNMKSINNLVDNINSGMKQLYKDTYISDRQNLDDMNKIADDIEDSISQIVKRNSDSDFTGVTKLYSKLALKNATGDIETRKKIEELFGDGEINNNLLSSYMSNKWIHDLDNEIDTVLKYCTKMGEALDLLKDAVLSSDSVNKDTLLVSTDISNESELSIFEDRIKVMTKKYNLNEKRNQWYTSASHYGETWVYVVPYNKAIKRILDKRNTVNGTITEMTIIENGEVNKEFASDNPISIKGMNNFRVEIDTSRSLSSALDDLERVNEAAINEAYGSLTELATVQEANKEKLDSTVPSDLELPKHFYDNSSSDGLYVNGRTTKSSSSSNIKIKGSVVQKLIRENLVPLYIQDTCMGYYYVEFNGREGMDFYDNMIDKYGRGYEAQAIAPITKTVNDEMITANTDNVIKNIANKIAAELDEKFINSNQDIAKEIYSILKYNEIFTSGNGGVESMKVSFLPVEDVHRLMFNEDEDTHRGISDCMKGLIPAKLFSCLYLTNVMGILTRGQDKRVYYVKQTVETNIAQTLLNVINQIKKSNFNIRQIENMNNILNIVGRFNDYYIPVGPSGDSPVQFEVMQGQNFEINSDLYNMLEEMAVNSTGVPMELVQSRNSPDFATQFTSSSIKILRTVFSRQSVVEEFLSEVYTKIYSYEYPDDPRTVKCELPPPIFLSMVNTTQLIQNSKEYVQQIAEMEFAGDDSPTAEKERAIFERKMLKSLLASYVKVSNIERFRKAAKFEIEKQVKIDNENM